MDRLMIQGIKIHPQDIQEIIQLIHTVNPVLYILNH